MARGGEQPVQAKGEEVNLLVSAQIKMLLNANEARQWGEPAAIQLTGIGWQSSLINPSTDYTTTPLPFLPSLPTSQKCPLELWQLLMPLSEFR